MIKLKKLVYESLLKEALPLSVAKEYASIEQNPSIKKKLDEIFNKLKNLPDAKSSKRDERIYIPYEMSYGESAIKDDIESVISKKGYKVKDYVKGIATDEYGRDVNIGKVLNKLKQPNLLYSFNTDTVRASSNKTDTYIVFSRHSYDIAGMSTDRDWSSCMNIYGGKYSDMIQYDVSDGSFIAYYVNVDDLNINKPIGRIVVRPFVNDKDKSDVVYSTAASEPHGNPPSGFEAMITKILDDIQNEQTGTFRLKSQLYCDVGRDSKIQKMPSIDKGIKNKSDIVEVLDSLNIENYTVNEDLSVDVDGDVDISGLSLTEIPMKFGKVTGEFICGDNRLTSLEGAPREVNHFDCSSNKLTDLKGSPSKVSGDFYVANNRLTSLEGAPREIGGFFHCSVNITLNELKGGPEKVGGDFICQHCNLRSLKGAPKEVGGNFECGFNMSNKFTEEEVRAVSDVKGKITV